MRHNLNSKVSATGKSAAEIARELEAVGHKLSSQQVRKDAARGAPLTSAGDYLAWKADNSIRTPRKVGERPSIADLKEKKLLGEIALLEEKLVEQRRDNQLRAGEVVERAKVRADVTIAASKAVAILQQKFETELPPKQDGLPAERIAEMNRAAIHEVCVILSSPEAWPSEGAGKTTTDSASPTTDTAITPGHANPASEC